MHEPQSPDRRLVEAGDTIEQRRFAGAVRSNERGDLTLAGIEAKVTHGGQAAETHGEMFHFENRRCAHAGPKLCVRSTVSVGILRRRRSDTEALRVDTRPRG